MVLFAQPCLAEGVRITQARGQKGEDTDAHLDFMCLEGACLACRLGLCRAAGHEAIVMVLLTPPQLQHQMGMYCHRMIWVGKNLKNHPVPMFLLWVQGHLPLDHIS